MPKCRHPVLHNGLLIPSPPPTSIYLVPGSPKQPIRGVSNKGRKAKACELACKHIEAMDEAREELRNMEDGTRIIRFEGGKGFNIFKKELQLLKLLDV